MTHDANAMKCDSQENCEPCEMLGFTNLSVGRTGMDFTPCCEWHYTHSWSSKPVAKSAVFLSIEDDHEVCEREARVLKRQLDEGTRVLANLLAVIEMCDIKPLSDSAAFKEARTYVKDLATVLKREMRRCHQM
jgi:hypothetical protein